MASKRPWWKPSRAAAAKRKAEMDRFFDLNLAWMGSEKRRKKRK
jgi:hypothetical protein